MPWVGFEPTIPASEGAKTVHALDLSATVTGYSRHRVKGKVVPVLCHEGVWWSGCIDPRLLTSALVGDEWSDLRPCRFTHGKGPPVGPRVLESLSGETNPVSGMLRFEEIQNNW
jgi:hypothetical protein